MGYIKDNKLIELLKNSDGEIQPKQEILELVEHHLLEGNLERVDNEK